MTEIITFPSDDTTFDDPVAIKDTTTGECAGVENRALNVNVLNSLVQEKYDDIDLGYTGDDLTTVEYNYEGNLVATLTLTYAGGNLTNVAKS